MSSPGSRSQPLPGRGLVSAAEFCEATGLPEVVVADLVNSGSLDGLVNAQGRLFGLFDDALPRADELRARGHVVDDAYDPELLRSRQIDDPDEPQVQDEGSPTWSIRWP